MKKRILQNNLNDTKNWEKGNDVVQETDSENNSSDINKSNKRILRRKSIK